METEPKPQDQEHNLHLELLPVLIWKLAESKMSLPSHLIPPEGREDVEVDVYKEWEIYMGEFCILLLSL